MSSWERSVSYLYHGAAGAKLEEAIGGHALLPASQSSLGIACLARITDSDVSARYKGHALPGFRTMKDLRAELAQTREQGYAFAHTSGRRRSRRDRPGSDAFQGALSAGARHLLALC